MFALSDKAARDHGADHGADQRGDADGARVMFEGEAEEIAAEAEHACPDDAAEGVEEEKSRPGQTIDAREERREGAQNRDEAAEEHDLAAMTHEQILRDFQPSLVDP